MDKKTCFFFLFVTFLYGVAQYTYMPILSSYAQTLGAGAFLVGFITGMNGTVSLFLRLPFSFLSDYLHKRKIFITASILFTFLAALIVCFWQSPASLIISRALAGVSMSTWVHYTVLFASYYPKEKMGYAVGMVNAIIVLGDFAGTFLCGFLAPRFGEISTYLAAALLALAALILCLLFIKEKVPEKQGHLSLPELFSVMKMPVVVFYSVLSAVALYIFFATGPAFTPLVAVENFAADQVQLSVLSALSLAATFASCLVCGLIPRWMTGKQVIAGSFLLILLANALTPYLPHFGLLCAAQTLNSFFSNFLSVYLQVLVIAAVAPKLETAATGFFQTIYALGIAFGPIGTGILQNMTGNYGITYLLLSLLPLAAMLWTIVWDRKRPIDIRI